MDRSDLGFTFTSCSIASRTEPQILVVIECSSRRIQVVAGFSAKETHTTLIAKVPKSRPMQMICPMVTQTSSHGTKAGVNLLQSPTRISDAILALAGSGRELWADEHADDYVRRLREGWE